MRVQFVIGLNFLVGAMFSSQVCAQECSSGWAPGPLLPDLRGANGPVHALLVYDPPGAFPPTLIVGGEFTRIGNIAANHIASWDGTVWHPLGSGTDNTAYALTVYNNNLIVGGRFHNAGGGPNKFIAAWNGSDWFSIGNGLIGDGDQCDTSLLCNYVESLAVFNGDLMAGGVFYIPGFDDEVTGIARLVNNSLWFPLFTVGTDPWYVGTMTVFDDDGAGPHPPALYVGGHSDDPLWSNFLKWSNAQWTPITWYWGNVNSFTVTNQGLAVGGYFMLEPFAEHVTYVAFWNGSSWSNVGNSQNWGEGVPWTQVMALRSYGNNLYAGGQFNLASGATASNMTRWDGSNWWGTGTFFSGNGYRKINEMRVFNNELYVGGDFNLSDGFAEVNHIAKFNGSTWSSLKSATSINALATIGSTRLVLGGDFGYVDGLSSTLDPFYLATWDGRKLDVLSGGVNGPVHALKSYSALSTDYLIAGGAFTLAGSQGGIGGAGGDTAGGMNPANRIAQWSNAPVNGGWQPLGNGFNNTVFAVERVVANSIFSDSIYAGGAFTASANNSTAFNRVAVWGGSPASWATLGTGFNNTVRALKGYNNSSFTRDLIAGGDFTTANGVAANRIALWHAPNTNGWTPMGNGFNAPVHAIELHAGSIYAGGAFTASGATTINHVARWTGSAWENVGSGFNGNVYALNSFNNQLFAACEVTVGSGLTFARWDGTSWTSVAGGVTSGAAKAILPFKTELIVGGAFEKSQGSAVASPGLARYRYQGIPWIIRQPISQTAACHATVIFDADLPTGYDDIASLRWFKNGVPLNNGWNGTGSSYVGAQGNENLKILDVSDADEGSYQLVITTSCGTISTTAVTLDVTGTCPPCPYDIAPQPVGNGAINVDDLLAVINSWGPCTTPPCVPHCPADVAPPGGNCFINVDDLLAIINHWGVCP